MQHFGDITKLHGWELPVVDIITGGSPCQDLSVAGQRAGLAGERSGLFMEQIRIIKEMRERDISQGRSGWLIRPRYMVFENVPGALSSNNGEDFRTILEETARIVEPDAVIPKPKKWSKSGCIMADGWSIAWRVHDAQFWGVPQRRARIALVADFGGESAPEILFERKGLRRDIEPSEKEAGQETSDRIDGSTNSPSRIIENHPNDSRVKFTDTFQALSGRMGTGGGNTPMVMAVDCRNGTLNEVNGCLQAGAAHRLNTNNVVAVENHPQDSRTKYGGA